MGRIVISVVLGLLSPFVFIMGAAPFEVHGSNSVKEVLAGCIAVALYLAVCQFLVARSSGPRLRADSAVTRGSSGEAIPSWQHKTSRISVLMPGWPRRSAMRFSHQDFHDACGLHREPRRSLGRASRNSAGACTVSRQSSCLAYHSA